MAKCYYCGDETQLHINMLPICVKCDAAPLEKWRDERKPQQVSKPPLLVKKAAG